MSITLKTVIFMGSAKNVSPPWGGEARVGDRALKLVQDTLASRSNTIGEVAVTHEVTTYDPLVVFGEGGALSHSGAEMRAPTFYQKPEELNEATTAMLQTIKGCDAILCVTAEYNHSVPPGLQSLLSHFGGSCYMCKPSGIVTYSVGPWGGARASIALQPILHELGALPVSKMVGLPTVNSILNEDGTWVDPEDRMAKQLPAMLNQLEWMAVAMKNQRELSGTF